MSPQPIYLDYNATTPVDPQARDAMLPFLDNHYGNPSSTHIYGQKVSRAIDQARKQTSSLIQASIPEIIFTSGGSESNNHALQGILLPVLRAWHAGEIDEPPHVITTSIEHPAIHEPCEFLRQMGARLTVLPVDPVGIVDPESVRDAIVRTPNTQLVSVMHANNEVGSIEPISQIADICHEYGVLMHTDAAQTIGKIPVRVQDLGVDLLTIAGHKVYAPKGIGVLYVKQGVTLSPLIHGAGHESGRRAGTENVPYIVALGKACELAEEYLTTQPQKLQQLRDRLWNRLRESLGEDLTLNGDPKQRLPNTLNVNFAGIAGQQLLENTPQIAASTGSACHAGKVTLSPVLEAMGVTSEKGRGAVRLSVGRFSDEEQIDHAARRLICTAQNLRKTRLGRLWNHLTKNDS